MLPPVRARLTRLASATRAVAFARTPCWFLLAGGDCSVFSVCCLASSFSLRCAITITGEALTHALSTAENRRYFFGLANLCSTVIACRVSPKQKSEVVTQCKRYQSGTVSLGIGDGANDVGMLVAANVGVGIQGKEGLQAVRAADFAIGEFK